MAEFQKEHNYGRVSKWNIWQSFKMDHMAEFQKEHNYGRVSEWTIWQSFKMDHMAEFQNGTYGKSFRMEIKISNVWLSLKRLMCLFAFTQHMATSCFDQAAGPQETLKTK